MPSFELEGGSFSGTEFLNANLRFGAEAVRISCSLLLKSLIAYRAEGSIRVVLRNGCGLSVPLNRCAGHRQEGSSRYPLCRSTFAKLYSDIGPPDQPEQILAMCHL